MSLPTSAPSVPVEQIQPTQDTRVHVFERRGLGVAPFRLVCVGDLGRVAASCDYCGTGIRVVCHIRGADGRAFKVGCDCVAKTGDLGLKKVVDQAKRERRYEQELTRLQQAVADAKTALEDPVISERLAATPHPIAFMAAKGLTRLEWAIWMLKNAGNRGRLDVARYLKKVRAA